ncbi:MAG: ribulose-phosphate 3-epimerase [Clostridia bacterium]|nr:ribulose-phosphate 3-epimerase [Clostridia bacterium]
MKKVLISPSILTLDFSNIQTQCAKLQRDGADWIHLDVMDGIFVPNSTFDWQLVSQVKQAVTIPLDVHLMVVDPINVVDNYAKAGADIITFHMEAAKDVVATIKAIKKSSCKVGISIKPATPVAEIEPYLPLIDMVLVMSVEPGFGGQKFMPSAVQRIAQIRALNHDILIQVDGGINTQTAPLVKNAGANVLVAGSAIVNTDNWEKAISNLR